MTHLLVVDDEQPFLRALSISLKAFGYDVATATSGEQALASISQRPPDLMVLDLGLPGMDGLATLAAVRRMGDLPVLVLTARGERHDLTAAFDAGADDFLAKPFAIDELLARLRAVLRRSGRAGSGRRLQTPDFALDFDAREATAADKPIHLTATEWRLLDALDAQRGSVVETDDLLRKVWGSGCDHQRDYVRVFVAGLRRKLEPDPSRPRYLTTCRGIGYRLMAPDSSPEPVPELSPT